MVLLPESKISAHIILIIDNIKTIWYARISPFPYAPIYATFSFLCMFGRRDVPFAAWSVPIGIQADAEQQNGQRTQDTGNKLWSRLGESLCEVLSFHKMSLAQLRLTSGCVHLWQIFRAPLIRDAKDLGDFFDELWQPAQTNIHVRLRLSGTSLYPSCHSIYKS